MKTAVFTGSFDPFTSGHYEIAVRAAKVFDKLYVVVMNNEEKTYKKTAKERAEDVGGKLSNINNISVDYSEGLAVDYCHKVGADYIVRGVRNKKDYEYENVMANYNKSHGGIETLYLLADDAHKNVSSTAERITKGDF